MNDQVSMRPCKKPHDEENNINTSSEGEEDHISNLPYGVVGHILSFLPIKDAVRTSVLSREWEHKWTSMCDIEIDNTHESLSGEDKVACFVNFVTRIFMRTCNSRIRMFSLSCEQSSPYHVNYLETWISWVLMRNVEVLKILVHTVQRLDSRWCFTGWTSLMELELHLSCTLVLPTDTWFPNLKKLSLTDVIMKAEQNLSGAGRIILKFPVLQVLVLRECEWLNVNIVEIHAHELISFQTSCSEKLKNYEIRIFGTKLAMFESSHGSIDNFDLHTPAISHASVSNSTFTVMNQQTLLMRTHKVLKQLPRVTYLKLSGEIVEALVPSSDSELVFPIIDWLNQSGQVFPTFNRLKEFHLGPCFIKDTLKVLQALPFLESLTFNTLSWNDAEERGEPWPPEILSNLKKIELRNFMGTKVQFDFSKFVLENASNLNEMSIFIGYNVTTVDVVTRRLSKTKLKNSSSRLVVL